MMLGKGVGAIRCLAQLLASLLFILLGTGFAVAKSQPLHNLSFFPAQINIAAQHATTGFDTRAPPSTVQYVAATGGFTVMQGSALVVHGQETVAVSFGFGDDLNATNNVELPNGYRVIDDSVGASRVDPPNGYRWVTDDGTPQLQSTSNGRIFSSADDVPTPTGNFSGAYEANPKHNVTRPGVSPNPTNGADTLANSVPLGGNSTGRIAYDQATGEIVVFQNHLGTAYHGYVPSSFSALRQAERNALIRAGLFTARGRPVR